MLKNEKDDRMRGKTLMGFQQMRTFGTKIKKNTWEELYNE
jgi:hypothetical protein